MTDPVIIVGAGPTGLAAALELSRLDIDVRLIEQAEAPATTSRAIGIQARTLELMQQRGLAEEMLRLGNSAAAANIYGGGKQLTRLAFGHLESRYKHILFLSQAETERILREAVGRQGVTIERGVSLVGFSQDALSREDSPVHASLRHADGRLEQASTPWLISAEGAHSLVRTTLDLQFEGKTLTDIYALGDLHVTGDLPDSDVHIFSSEHGFMAMFPMGGSRFRLIANTPAAPQEGRPPALDELQTMYDQRSHIPVRLHDMGWSSWFHINSRMVQHLKRGRVLLGGDSAHIHSPAGAQGMNTGIQDMINLGWKLAMVIRGEAPAHLLDSYEQDRLPVIRNVLARTEAMTGVMGSENPLIRALINHVGPWVGDLDLVQHAGSSQMSQIALGYRDSPLSANHPHGGALHAGDRVPDFRVDQHNGEAESPARLQDLLDPSRFTVLVTHGAAAPALDPALQDAANGFSDIARILHLSPAADAEAAHRFEAAFGRRISVFLVRPDGYVGMASGEASAACQLAAYRAQWLTVT